MLFVVAAFVGVVFLALKVVPKISPERFERYGRYTFVVRNETLTVVSLFPSEDRAMVLLVPTDLYVGSAHGYGQIKAGSLFNAGELDHRGNLVVKDTLSDLLGLDVSQIISQTGQIINQDKQINRWVFFSGAFWKQAKLDNFLEMFKIAKTWSTLRSDKVHVFSLGDFAYSSETILADGSTAQTLDQENVDKLISGEFTSGIFRGENLRVGVINSTTTNGLGNRASRVLSNSGVEVVGVETKPIGTVDCEVQYFNPKLKSSKVLSFAAEYFSCHVSLNPQLDNRFDMEIIVGSKFEQKFSK